MIEAKLYGRLGNQMFQYAVCRTVAKRNDYNFYIPTENRVLDGLFECDMGTKDGEIQYDYFDTEGQKFDPSVFDVKDFTRLNGFFQSEKYFNRNDVKKWFSFNITEEAQLFLDKYPPKRYCYINIRGGDHQISQLTLPRSYYKKAVETILMFNNTLDFIILTDDIAWADEYFTDIPTFSHDRNTDFSLLYSARYVISAISTFCWWACYLQDYNVTIAPRGFYAYHDGEPYWSPMDIKTNKFIWI